MGFMADASDSECFSRGARRAPACFFLKDYTRAMVIRGGKTVDVGISRSPIPITAAVSRELLAAAPAKSLSKQTRDLVEIIIA